jgi:putative addiction module component (TIGR02574 family)
MSDLRNQIDSLSAAEKAELLDAVWESLEADALSLTEAQRAELDYRIVRHEQNPSDVIPWEQVRAGLFKNLDAAGRLDTGSGRGVERSTWVVREHTPRARGTFRAGGRGNRRGNHRKPVAIPCHLPGTAACRSTALSTEYSSRFKSIGLW